VFGHDYKVQFRTVDGQTVWDIVDVTQGNKVVLADQTNQSGDASYSVVDGVQVKVLGPDPGMNPGGEHVGWDIPTGTRRFTFADADPTLAFALEGFSNSIGWGDHWFSGTTVTPAKMKNVLLVLAKASSGTTGNTAIGETALYAGWDRKTTTDPNMSYGYRYLRGATAAAARPEFEPYIINKTPGYAYQDYEQGVPLAAYDIETNPPTRLAVGHLENNVASGMVDGCWWPIPNGLGVTNVTVREWLFIFDSPYTGATPDPSLQTDILNNTVPMMYLVFVNRRGGNDFNPTTESGTDQFRMFANHVNTETDTYTYSTAGIGVTQSTDLAKADINLINVFPNPYFGAQSVERDPINRFVTFSHLPMNEKTTIRIFTLAGALVRSIDHTPGSTFERWDLRNANGIPVASAMYLVHIEMQGLGTKILKVAIIQPEERLDRL
jgi:hypothetical protein